MLKKLKEAIKAYEAAEAADAAAQQHAAANADAVARNNSTFAAYSDAVDVAVHAAIAAYDAKAEVKCILEKMLKKYS